MRTKGSAQELEQRRLRAIAIVEEGHSQREAARRVKVHERTVRKWVNAFRRRGKAGVAARPTPGRPRRLGRDALSKLERVLLKGAQASGYATELWTARRVAEVVKKECGVTYNAKYIPEVLKLLGWSPQKPQRRAVERDEQEIARWKLVEWARIKKKPPE